MALKIQYILNQTVALAEMCRAFKDIYKIDIFNCYHTLTAEYVLAILK